MSLPDPSPGRKLRYWGLLTPFMLLGLAVAAWSGFWIWARGQTVARMDAYATGLAQAGYPVTWKTRTVYGYPFRMDVSMTDVVAQAPSGWALQASRIEAEAPMHAVTHWIIAVPQGLVFVRPIGGPVAVKADLLRASLNHFDQRPPSFSLEGVKLTFTPQPGAQPFALSTAGRVEFHLRAGPNDEGGVFASLQNGAAASGLFARIAAGKPVAIVWNSTLAKMSAFTGRDWPSAVRHWGEAGGLMTLRDGSLTLGDAEISANGGKLGVGRDGRLSGLMDVRLRQADRVLAALSDGGQVPPEAARSAAAVVTARQQADATAQATITFQAGQATLGPVAIGAAPKIYETP